MITFEVDNVKKNNKNDISKWHFRISNEQIKNLFGPGIEASSFQKNDSLAIANTNNFIAALNIAYDNHLPLVLSPDHIWLLIAQGFSLHINNNAEKLRHQFVNFEGKKKIEIVENSFVKGSPDNNWQHTFTQFSDRIKEFIGKKRDLIVGEFSTTGPVEKAANEIVLMESMKNYFEYSVMTMCGFPEITLLGTVEDWKNIRSRVIALNEFDLSWWTEKLIPVIDEFIMAANGNPNYLFWQNFYKVNNESGGPYINGQILKFFPYLKDWKTKEFCVENDFKEEPNHSFSGKTSSQLPVGLAKVPFVWNYYGKEFNMELIAGFAGFNIDENSSVTPHIGWAVRDCGDL